MTLLEKLTAALFQQCPRIETSPVPVKMIEEWSDGYIGEDHIYTVKLEWACHTKVDSMSDAPIEEAKKQVVKHFARTLYEDLRGPLLDLRYVIDTNADPAQRVKLLDMVQKIEEVIEL